VSALASIALRCATPAAWLEAARTHRDELLIDHANCEKKAAGTALSLLYRYVEHGELLRRLSRLAREELRHFEQVLALMRSARVEYRHVSPGRYARSLKTLVRTFEPARLLDTLLVGALVEARSCERFEQLSRVFDGAMGDLYRQLLASEARHASAYLELARRVDDGSGARRLDELLEHERVLIESADTEFRFHSGPPQAP